MDYWSILVSGVLGALGGGLGYWIVSKFSINKQFASIAGMIGAILFYQTLHPIVYGNYLKPMIEKSNINKILKQVEKENKALLPRMLDEVTRQDRIEATDLRIKYEYTIINGKIDKNQFDKNFDELKKNLKFNTCQDKGSKFLIHNRVTFEYVYKLESTPYLFRFELNNCE